MIANLEINECAKDQELAEAAVQSLDAQTVRVTGRHDGRHVGRQDGPCVSGPVMTAPSRRAVMTARVSQAKAGLTPFYDLSVNCLTNPDDTP